MNRFMCEDCYREFSETDFTSVIIDGCMEHDLFCPYCNSEEWVNIDDNPKNRNKQDERINN